LNDIYDYAWTENNYDHLVIMGNDVIPYPKAIDSLIEVADTHDYEWICASQYEIRDLLKDFPQYKPYFGSSCRVTDFSHRCWEEFKNWDRPLNIIGPGMSDVHNLALYKRAVYDKVGYIDTNFYPAYFSDNDYCRRSANLGVSSCTLTNAIYFHFWSRTIHQESGGSNHEFFRANASFYITKWGGPFGEERFSVPFNGYEYVLCPGVPLKSELRITDRSQEKDIIRYWKHR
jgi:GT2 family glycosyltransferase